MQTRGAILRQAPGKYEVVDLEVDDPRPGEIQVKLVASGLCHSDDHVATGDIPVGVYPFAGGHEGAGIVTKAGTEPQGPQGGRPRRLLLPALVRALPLVRLGQAEPLRPRRRRCSPAPAGTTRPTSGSSSPATDTPVGQMCGISTFVETTTVSADSAVKVADDVPLDKACLVGCGVGTGWGSAVNAAAGAARAHRDRHGRSAASASTRCRARRTPARPTSSPSTRSRSSGRTPQQVGRHARASSTMEEATELAQQFTNGQGADSAIVTVGVIKPESRRSGHGVDPQGRHRRGHRRWATSPTRPRCRSRWPTSRCSRSASRARCSAQSNPNWDILRQVELYRSGVLKLDELITKTYTLDRDRSRATRTCTTAKNIRGVIIFD